MNAKTFAIVCGMVMALTAHRAFSAATTGNDLSLLTSCYFRYLVAEQVPGQTAALTKAMPADTADQVQTVTAAWHKRQMDALRADLEAGLGDQAQARFEKFIGDFLQAEKSVDGERLAQLSQSLRLDPAPADYPAFRKVVIDSVISKEMSQASCFLGEVQTWADLRGKNPNVPPLDIWLSRAPSSHAAATPLPRSQAKKPVEKLADAEAAAPDLPEADAQPSSSPTDSFAAKRKEKHAKALAEANAGMEQVAAERQDAEQENAAKKLAAAQADADNIRQHAGKLAAVEMDALEQRQNSWGNRLKSIVGATVSAGVGAFAGGIGARAGDEVVSAIFNDDKGRRR